MAVNIIAELKVSAAGALDALKLGIICVRVICPESERQIIAAAIGPLRQVWAREINRIGGLMILNSLTS